MTEERPKPKWQRCVQRKVSRAVRWFGEEFSFIEVRDMGETAHPRYRTFVEGTEIYLGDWIIQPPGERAFVVTNDIFDNLWSLIGEVDERNSN